MMRLPCLCVYRNMNVFYPTPPHPTPAVTDDERAVPVSAGEQERWWGCRACVCTGTWTLLSHPTPPHLTSNWWWKSCACVCRTARKMMRLPCLPSSNWWWKSSACCRACVCVQEHERYDSPPHPTPPHRQAPTSLVAVSKTNRLWQ